MEPSRAVLATTRRSRWWYFAIPAVISLVTMPITAIWFLMIGVLVGLAGTPVVLIDRSERGERRGLDLCAVSAGILVGPMVYLGLSFAN